MSALSISVPYPVFSGQDGLPLDNGYVWIGTANLYPITNPIAVYFDEALTIQATQPLRTINGFISNAGTPAQVYVDAVNFSILVQDSKGSMIYNFADGTGISPDACGVTYNPPFTGGVAYPVCEKLEQTVSVKDFGAVGNGVANDSTAVLAAINAAAASNQELFFPSGEYLLTSWSPPTITSPIKIYGEGIDKSTVTGPAVLVNFLNMQESLVINSITLNRFDKTIYGRAGAGVVLPYDEMTFTGVRFTGSTTALFLEGVSGDNVQSGLRQLNIQSCRFDTLTYYGLAMTFKRCDNAVIDGNIFTGFTGDQSVQAVFFGFDQIVPATRKMVSITNNFVSAFLNTFAGPRETHAFMIHEADACYIAGNTIVDIQNSDPNGEDCEGIYIRDVGNAIVTNNILRSIRTYEAYIDIKEDCLYAQVTDNVIDNTAYANDDFTNGIMSFVGNCVISRNTIKNVGGYGINVVASSVTGTEPSVIQENFITGVGAFAGIFAFIGNGSVISNNVISDIKDNYATNPQFGSLAIYDTNPSGIFFIGKTASPNLQMNNNRLNINVSVAHATSYGFNLNAVTSLGNVTMMDNVIRSATQRYIGNVAGGTEAYSVGSFNLEQILTGQEGFLRFNDGTKVGGVSYDHTANTLVLRTNDNAQKTIVNTTGDLYPATNNTMKLGIAGNRWSEVFAVNGAINTSDERWKVQREGGIDEAVLRAWGKVNYVQYKMKHAVEKKGNSARWHFGVIAQRVKEAFESEGLDPFAYGILCWDEWADQYEAVLDKQGQPVCDADGVPTGEKRLTVAAGESYGIRYEEALALECAYLRNQLKGA
jgi:hypothetical protein